MIRLTLLHGQAQFFLDLRPSLRVQLLVLAGVYLIQVELNFLPQLSTGRWSVTFFGEVPVTKERMHSGKLLLMME